MNSRTSHARPPCGRIARRAFLADMGMGFTGLALGNLLLDDGVARADAVPAISGAPHFAPKAKQVIWLFLSGGYSHLETFDPKPALNKYAGKTFKETPFPDPFASPLHAARSRSVVAGNVREKCATILPLQVGYRKYGLAGVEVSDWWPHLATCVDDLAFVRSMYTTDNDHAAEVQMHTGRHKLDEPQPSLGSWIQYGLGSANENLPKFMVLGDISASLTEQTYGAEYLGPSNNGIRIALDPKNPLPYGARAPGMFAEEQQTEYGFINELNELRAVEYPRDEQLRARIRSYELAFRMQAAVPEALSLASETKETQDLYGLDNPTTRPYGERLLTARRLAERGVRYTLVYLNSYGDWDAHLHLRDGHSKSCAKVDKPIAGLVKDLKRRGLFKDVLLVLCTEFGRTPGLQTEFSAGNKDGRDHHPCGFTVWLAGAGIRPGVVHGATDELGFHAVQDPHYVTDIHATVLSLMGVDGRRLAVPGRKRLDIDYGKPIHQIMA